LEGAVGRARFDLACPPLILEANHVDDLLTAYETVWNAAQLVPPQDATRVILNAAAGEISDRLRDWNSPANRRQETRRAVIDRYNDDLVPRLQRLEVRLAEATGQASWNDPNLLPPEHR
ncbi:MAG: hypothetical protein ACRDT4_25730, partial [Micromonosporaceae bacterium]